MLVLRSTECLFVHTYMFSGLGEGLCLLDIVTLKAVSSGSSTAIHLGTHTSKHHELSSELHLCLRIQKDFTDHWHEIRESFLWVRQSRWYWTRCSYCGHCLARCNWFCLVSLVLGNSASKKEPLNSRLYWKAGAVKDLSCRRVPRSESNWWCRFCLFVWIEVPAHAVPLQLQLVVLSRSKLKVFPVLL